MHPIDPISIDLANSCQKEIARQQRAEVKAAVTAFKTAGVNPLADFKVFVGALDIAATCSDPELLESYRLAGEAAIKRLPGMFEPQAKTGAPAAAAMPAAEKEADGVAAGVVEETIAAKDDEPAKLVDGAAVDLIAIVTERLAPDAVEAMESLGLVCNTDTRRRKKPMPYLWHGHAVPGAVEAIVLGYDATVNPVKVPAHRPIEPLAEGAAASANTQDVAPEQLEMAMPTDLKAEDHSTFDIVNDTLPVARAGVDEARDPATDLTSTENDDPDAEVIVAPTLVAAMDHASSAST